MGRCGLTYLLGEWSKRNDANSGKLLDGERDNWKSDPKVVEATVQYLQKTGRLTNQPKEGQVGEEKDLHSFYPLYKLWDKAADFFCLVRCLYRDSACRHRE